MPANMPLWTPYIDDEALDLSKPEIKREPTPSPPAQGIPEYQHAARPRLLHHADPGIIQWPAQINHVLYPLPCYPVSPASIPPQNHSYPSPVPQVSPASGNSSSMYDNHSAYLKKASLSPPLSPPVNHNVGDISESAEFQAFERDALQAMALKNGGTLLGNNPRMRRAVRSTNENAADDSYKTQRQRNNFAAKQSRDRRKMREIQLALKVTYLSNMVAKLKADLARNCCGRCHQPCACGQ